MMGGKTWDEWIDDYSESHQHPINKLTHKLGIPMIAVSLLLIPVSFFVAGFWRIALGLFVSGLDSAICRALFRRQAARIFQGLPLSVRRLALVDQENI